MSSGGDRNSLRDGKPHADALRDLRRSRILDAAQKVFSERGLEGGSVRAIAAAADCTTGAIYSQFASKEEVYAAVLAQSLQRLLAAVREGAAIATGAEGLRGCIDAFFGYYVDQPSELALGLYLFRGIRPVGLGRELDARLNAQLAEVLEVFASAMAEVRPDLDASREVDLETAALFSFLLGLLIVHQTRRVTVIHRAADELLAHYEAGLIGRLTG